MVFDENASVDSDDEPSIDNVDPVMDNRDDRVDDKEEMDGDEQLEEQQIAPTGEYSIDVIEYF